MPFIVESALPNSMLLNSPVAFGCRAALYQQRLLDTINNTYFKRNLEQQR